MSRAQALQELLFYAYKRRAWLFNKKILPEPTLIELKQVSHTTIKPVNIPGRTDPAITKADLEKALTTNNVFHLFPNMIRLPKTIKWSTASYLGKAAAKARMHVFEFVKIGLETKKINEPLVPKKIFKSATTVLRICCRILGLKASKEIYWKDATIINNAYDLQLSRINSSALLQENRYTKLKYQMLEAIAIARNRLLKELS